MARKIIEPITVPKRHAHECPQCGGAVHRVSRTSLQRLLAVLFPSKRYRCADPSCQWEGLLRSRQFATHRRKHVKRVAETLTANALTVFAVLAVVALGLALLWTLVQ